MAWLDLSRPEDTLLRALPPRSFQIEEMGPRGLEDRQRRLAYLARPITMLPHPSTAPAAAAPTPSAIDRLNAVVLSGQQLAAALAILALLPASHQHDPHAQAQALQAYAADTCFADDALAGAALHARVTALAKWTAAHDPARQSDPQAVLEAAARHPLIDTGTGIGFEAAVFQEMVLFLEELPW